MTLHAESTREHYKRATGGRMQDPAPKKSNLNAAAVAALLVVSLGATGVLASKLLVEEPAPQSPLRSKKKLKELSPFPEVLSASFKFTSDRWVANGPVTDEEVIALADNQQVRRLELKFAEIGPESLRRLQKETLLELKLDQVPLNAKCMEELSRMPRLKVLYIRDHGYIDNTVLSKLTGPSTVEDLSIKYAGVTDEAIPPLVAAFPDLDDLDLAQCDKLTDKTFSLLKPLSKLKSLDLSSAKLTDECVPAISDLHLQALRIPGTGITDSGVASLAKLNIGEIEIGHNQRLTHSALNSFAKMKGLNALGISGCPKITQKAIETFRKKRPEVVLSL